MRGEIILMVVLLTLAVIAVLVFAARASAKGTLPPLIPALPGVNSSTTVKIAQAIAAAEGWYVPNSLPRRLNNPGALKLDGHTLTQFSSEQEGWNALYHQVDLMITGQSKYYDSSMTWREIAVIYTGGDNPNSWAANVTSALGVSPDSTLGGYAT